MTNSDQSSEAGSGTISESVSASETPAPSPQPQSPKLLAVDCGLKTGLALYSLDGQLLWYRSHNLGNRQRLKKAAWQILREIEGLTHLVIEGGGPLADIWVKEGKKRGLKAELVQAERWRSDLLLSRQRRTGRQAKQVADELAREFIAEADISNPTSLRHDAAEAILVGWWVIQELRKTCAR